MNGKEIISILLTLIVGFCFGIFLYFTGFIGIFEKPNVQTQTAANSFTIISEVYGSCLSSCPSFQIASDGSYRYLFTPAAGEEQIIRDGSLARSLRRDISQFVTAAALDAQSQKIQPSVCNSYTDGIDVKYRVTISSDLYVLDTCGTDIDINSNLWKTLVKIWSYFETGRF